MKNEFTDDAVLKFNGSKFYYNSKDISVDELKAYVNKNNFPPDVYEAFKENGEVYVY